MYPTTAKLIAGALLAALAWYVSSLVRLNLPSDAPMPWLGPVNAAVGFVLGWRGIGGGAGRGYVTAIGVAWSVGALLVLVCLFIWAGKEALDRAMELFYDGPVAAIEAAIGLGVGYAGALWPGNALPALIGGTALIGLVVEWVWRRTD